MGRLFPVDEVLTIARQLADALEAAHEQGIIHRDLKPSNIKVRADGTVKVLDFGLAKLVNPVDAGGNGLGDPSVGRQQSLTASPTVTSPALMTGAGVILGTAAYMAPEQARGKAVDKRADIWAFGCVVYELLTGRRAFEGDEVPDTLVAVLSREPAWAALPREAASTFEPLLRRCLVKDPRKRLRDIGEARLVLDGLMDGGTLTGAVSGQLIPTKRASFKQALFWMVASVLATAVTAVGIWVFVRPRAADAVALRATILPTEGTSSSLGPFGAQLFAISPDGRQIALVMLDADRRRHLWVRPTDSLTARLLRGTEDAIGPFWSPDSQSIGFAIDGRLQRVSVAGGLPLTICQLPGPAGSFSAGTWGPDNTVLFSTLNSGGVFRVSAAGGQPVAVTRLDSQRGELSHSQPSFLPDGRHFLFFAGGRSDPVGLYVGSIDSADRVRVLERGSRARYAAGYLFFTRDRELVAQPFNLKRFTLESDAVTLAEPIDVCGAQGASGAFSVSTAGVVVYRGLGAEATARLEWLDRKGSRVAGLGDAGPYTEPELSPDGSRTAFKVRSTDIVREGDLWLYDNASGRRTHFTSGPTDDTSPVWSPDGRSLAFAARQPGPPSGWLRVKALAASEDTSLLDEQNVGVPTSWSHDGRYLLFSSWTLSGTPPRPGPSDIWALSMTGERKPLKYRATPFDEAGGVFSPDDRWVAYYSNESGRDEIYVASFPNVESPKLVSSGGGVWPQWRHDGHELFYLSLDGQLMAVDVMPASSILRLGTPHVLFQTNTQLASKPYSPAPDGQRFLFATSVGEASPAPLTVLVRRW
jgi:Tol biopolymer transport system component